MKHLILPALALAALATSFTAQAQNNATRRLVVALNSGDTARYVVSDIASLSFEKDEPETPATAQSYAITIPTDFADGRVMKVMAGGKQVAEVAYEWVRDYTTSANSQLHTVVYPMGTDGYADITRGLSATTGQTIAWNRVTNVPTITGDAGSASATVYLNADGSLSLTSDSDSPASTTTEVYYLVDKRGSETISYQIVKIGARYWTAENLRATKFIDGTDIPYYSSTQGEAWNANTTGARHLRYDDEDNLLVYGYHYSGYCFDDEANMIPEGWALPTPNEFDSCYIAAGQQTARFRSTSNDWGTSVGTNTSGFNAYPTGNFNGTTGDYDSSTTILTQFWTNHIYFDVLDRTKTDPYRDYFQVTSTGRTKNLSDGSLVNKGHSRSWGHSVRFVRK